MSPLALADPAHRGELVGPGRRYLLARDDADRLTAQQEHLRRDDAARGGMNFDVEAADPPTLRPTFHDDAQRLERDRPLEIDLDPGHLLAFFDHFGDHRADECARSTTVHGVRPPWSGGEQRGDELVAVALEERDVFAALEERDVFVVSHGTVPTPPRDPPLWRRHSSAPRPSHNSVRVGTSYRCALACPESPNR